MSSKPNIENLFNEWNELNTNAQKFLGEFDFAKIKEIRAKQKKSEDSIYEILKSNALDDIKKILPEDCGEMEVGYDTEGDTFYYVMIDPESPDEEIKLNAITIDVSKKISMIKDFEIE